MKLFTHYSRINFLASILALALGSVSYYFIIRTVLIHQLDDTLKVEEAEILNYVRLKDQLPEPANYRDQQIAFEPADKAVERQFQHISRRDPYRNNERGPFRQLLFPVSAGGRVYTVSVRKSEVETEEMLQWIMFVTAGMILLLLGILFLANRLLIRRLWQPFYQTLEALKKFNLTNREPLHHAPTSIREFQDLQRVVDHMTGTIRKDYEMLKEFADNASHEMQTPLAIINSKLDLMIQDQGLEERHLRQLQAMYDAVSRMRQLNQSLLLLTKIENHQFVQAGPVALDTLISEKLVQLEDLIQDKHLTLRVGLQPCLVQMNAYLSDILLSNLLVNAIRHNEEKGAINIQLGPHELRISNTGVPLPFDPASIFDRFTKSSQSEGTGLGLAIVRQICDNYGFSLSYVNGDGWHTIRIGFTPEYHG
ncbi:HAMP domain-containing sensor histidine kinase [Flavitalea sp. BT771]|uniref:sensor histidine kinase n=1 Tax=Flavitalea sp. BT771 TaxID=3063329 RepID=UPI0026E2682C|nr:HAMP domain-containing sensor histidine kinase [Flavitalea sp. BT771]MDO6434653.1 HAMP domain-containing sensor histidine kinase [Flavitalea sp. BT771]MDV6223553.1 HAMP domain-containing sensor histidine kinase [Flavitalea sp. BT771]